MTRPSQLHRSLVVPLTTALVALSALSSFFVATSAPPDLKRVSPDLVQGAVVISLVVFGVALPLLALMRRGIRFTPRLGLGVAYVLALMVHAVSMSSLIRTPPQATTSGLAMAACCLLVVLWMTALTEQQNDRPVKSSFGR